MDLLRPMTCFGEQTTAVAVAVAVVVAVVAVVAVVVVVVVVEVVSPGLVTGIVAPRGLGYSTAATTPTLLIDVMSEE